MSIMIFSCVSNPQKRLLSGFL
uniref:Uncharacterized protein n=1 Tax=Rhizophora mucronata TaxID=61149 RepID=A0A2P2QTG0_RHIMU